MLPRVVYRPPELLADRSTHYCPGCGHGIIHRLVAEQLGEMDLAGRTIAVASVGCSVFAYDYLAVDFVESPHGRAPAVATGVRRARPDAFVFTYQGDGDLAAIGTAEIVHAAARGERISVIFVNNGIYGMTGGQMAPTTLLGQHTTSSPEGRDAGLAGFPIPITALSVPSTDDSPSWSTIRICPHPPRVRANIANSRASPPSPKMTRSMRGVIALLRPRGLGHGQRPAYDDQRGHERTAEVRGQGRPRRTGYADGVRLARGGRRHEPLRRQRRGRGGAGWRSSRR